ncbi:hypothetical protein F0562_000424 [Nyssa sinensis]|uniref:Uncharacterized protein n=1 Tax=Nyssa sinensis TaxID=561372 RepID=A0A5J5C3N5_9ASTE|nr:hypothetical protein F0562_000424 [Nyssa sinensis]
MLETSGNICPTKSLFDSLRTRKEEQPRAKFLGIPPQNELFDMSKNTKFLILPNEEGILPSKEFLDTFRNFRLGKSLLIFDRIWPWNRLLEMSSAATFVEEEAGDEGIGRRWVVLMEVWVLEVRGEREMRLAVVMVGRVGGSDGGGDGGVVESRGRPKMMVRRRVVVMEVE